MKLEEVILRDTRANQPAATDVAVGSLYYVTDENVTERSDGTSWEDYSDAGSGGTPAAHASSHASAGSDPVTLAESQITGLVADLAGKASTTHASSHIAAGSDPLTLSQSQITNLTTDLAGKASTTHAATHSSASSDPVTVTNLAGFPGGSTSFLRADATFATPPGATVRKQISVIIDGGGAVITTGVKAYVSLPAAGTWQKWRILADVSGSIVFDIWKDVFANYPPVVADTITASAKPTLSAATSAESSSLTGWTTSFSAGDVIGINVDSVSTVTKVTLSLEYE